MDARGGPTRPARPPAPNNTQAQAPTPPSTATASRNPVTAGNQQSQSKPSEDGAASTSKTMASHKSFDSTKSSRGSKDSLVAKVPSRKASQEASPTPQNANDQLLKALKSEFDTLRSLITCKICYGLLYEPYTTACGHTYCYTCLCKSFKTTAPQSCPECRTRLHHPPAPAYLVRELTHSFIKRAELLPPEETPEQHTKWQKEHADIIQQDKDNKERRTGGIWRGFFRRSGPRPPRPAFRDVEDGVDRCPYCQWELEDGSCQRCGLPFDENGTGTWDFSDIEGQSERSERDVSSEQDADVEIDMEEQEEGDDFLDNEEALWDDVEEWYDQYGSRPPLTLQRFLQNAGVPGLYPHAPRRPAAHSAAGSRRRSYPASMVSEMAETEMGTVEEEDEEEEEDSSMNDFIEQDDELQSSSIHAASSTYSSSRASAEPPIIEEEDEEDTEDDVPVRRMRQRVANQSSTPSASPSMQHSSHNRTNMRILSETPSTASATPARPEEEDDDEEPIPVRRRRRRDTTGDQSRRVRQRQRGSSVGSSAAPTTASSEWEDHTTWTYQELRDAQRVQDEDNDGGEESDGGRTTVGWEPITNSNERNRNTGSLTPTADRPQAVPRPASRTGSNRHPRALRRRGSTISTTNDHYEDNDADDDVSDTDQDGDTNMNRPTLRQQTSRIRLGHAPSRRVLGRAQTMPVSIDNESDDTDISSQSAQQEQMIRQRQQEYNPRISLLFAQHQTDLRDEDVDNRPTFAEFEHLRTLARTPLTRPRTGNRNRIATYPVMSSPGPISRATPPAHNISRYRNSVEGNTIAPASSNARPFPERSTSGSSRTSLHSTTSNDNNNNHHNNGPNSVLTPPPSNAVATPSSPSTMRSRSQFPGSQTMSPMPAAHAGDSIERPASRLPAARVGDSIERPVSRVAYRPPSATGRRGSAGRSPFPAPPTLSPMGPGLNTARTWQHNNPFFNAAGIRPRQSSQRLREQSSTATLRARGSSRTLRQPPSVINVRDATEHPPLRPRSSTRTIRQQPSQNDVREVADQSPPQMRPQASRLHLRPQPSNRRLHQAQISRDAALAHLLDPSRTELVTNQRYSPNTASTLSEDERQRRANELVQRRTQELAQERNPFSRRPRQNQSAAQPSVQSESTNSPAYSAINRTAFPTSNGMGPSSMQNLTAQSPGLGRRRSSRSLAVNPQSGFVPASVVHSANTGSLRSRPGFIPSRSPYDSHVPTTMVRGISALTTGGDSRGN